MMTPRPVTVLWLLLLFTALDFSEKYAYAFYFSPTLESNNDIGKVAKARINGLGDVNDVNTMSNADEPREQTNRVHVKHNPLIKSHRNSGKEEQKVMATDNEKTINLLDTLSKTYRRKNWDKVLRFQRQKKVTNKETKQVIDVTSKIMHTEVSCKMNKTLKMANCSNLGLTKVPQHLSSKFVITTLILSNNDLDSNALANGPFKPYGHLTSLYLDTNKISSLPDKSFVGLPHLQILNLHNNSIKMDSALNKSIGFAPLKMSLTKLILNNNTHDINAPGLAYPDKAFSYLTNLQTLAIDGLPNTRFGFHFLQMKNLTTLSLEGFKTGKCNLNFFQNYTFENLPTLRSLNISDCKINKTQMAIAALANLTKLESLDISYNYNLGLDGFGKLMYGQRDNMNLKHIDLKFIGQRYEPCIVVFKETLRYIKDLHLESIDATHNNIQMIEYGALEYLPKTLKKVNITRNSIMFGAYWKQLKDLPNLQYLYLDGFDIAYNLPLQTPPENIHCPPHSESERRVSDWEHFKKETVERNETGNEHYSKKIIERNENSKSNEHLSLQLPPHLENITMRSYTLSYIIDTIIFNPINKLYSVDLHGNYLPKLKGPIYGLNSLKYLDISSCSVGEIARKFFSYFKSLKTVNLYGNRLGDSLKTDQTMFASESLEELNLGSNGVYEMNADVFKVCPNLSTLTLSDNRIRSIDTALDNLPKLTHLYLDRNFLSTLPKTVIDHFNKMMDARIPVYIDMSFNPISCNCDNIEFIEWIVHSKIFGNNYTDYVCYYSGKRSITMQMNEGYDKELKLLINQCADNAKLFICVISATVAFFFILIGVIIYRFRWNMRYWYYVVKVMLTKKSNSANMEEFEYDLFVCHCPQDKSFVSMELEPKLEEERGLKLLLHERYFQAGHTIAENILMAVQRSRKTLVVMSKAMMESNWCNYQLEMARLESISTDRNVLVILFLEKIPMSSMNLDMINYIRSNVIVNYPTNPEEHEEFWDKLAHDLKSS